MEQSLTPAQESARQSEALLRSSLARPFYQDLYGAQLHHGVRLPSDPLDYAAYYPALRRLVQLMGAAHRESRP